MSFKIAVVAEDHRIDQYILKPLVEAAARAAGKPHARVTIVTNPQMTGFEYLLKHLCEVIQRYGTAGDLVVVAIDTDCDDGRAGRRNKPLEAQNVIATCGSDRPVVVVPGVQEIEVWALWGVRGELGATWQSVREECDPKERFLEPLLGKVDRQLPDKGRRRLIESSMAQGWQSLKSGCPELQALEDGIRTATS